MSALPIPFFTAFLLLILVGANHRQLRVTPTGRVFAAFLYVNVVAAVCIGFRWSHDLIVLLPIAATLAVISAGLLYLAFCSLGRHGPVIELIRDWPHLIPALLVIVAVIVQPHYIELILILTKFFYAGLMVRLARRAPRSLQLVQLHWFTNAQQALWASAILLILSAGVDMAIAIDFAVFEGRHAAGLVGMANLVSVCLLGWAAIRAGQGMGLDGQRNRVDQSVGGANAESETNLKLNVESQSTTDTDDSAEDAARLLEQLNKLLIDQRLYADTELNLQKLARKAGIPPRTVSRTINSQTGKNLSQWINAARVEAACGLLTDKNVSVSQAMHEAGFLTKSNFNREFRRIAGCNPSQWRAKQ